MTTPRFHLLPTEPLLSPTTLSSPAPLGSAATPITHDGVVVETTTRTVCGVCETPIRMAYDIVSVNRGWSTEVRAGWWEHETEPSDGHEPEGPEV